MAVRSSIVLAALVAAFLVTGCGKSADADSSTSGSVPAAPKANAADAATTSAADASKDAAEPNGMPGGGPKGGK